MGCVKVPAEGDASDFSFHAAVTRAGFDHLDVRESCLNPGNTRMTQPVVPEIKDRACRGVGGGNQGKNVVWDGPNVSRDFCDVVPMDTVKNDVAIDDDVADVTVLGDGHCFLDQLGEGEKVLAETGNKQCVHKMHNAPIRLCNDRSTDTSSR
jgi:hypothetical protein